MKGHLCRAALSKQGEGYILDSGRNMQRLQHLRHGYQILRPIARAAFILMANHPYYGCARIFSTEIADAQNLCAEEKPLFLLGCANINLVAEEGELHW